MPVLPPRRVNAECDCNDLAKAAHTELTIESLPICVNRVLGYAHLASHAVDVLVVTREAYHLRFLGLPRFRGRVSR